MTDICIFSRNRPLQLHALLKSIQTRVMSYGNITILHRYDEEYSAALEEVKQQFPNCNFSEDNNFKDQVCDFLSTGGDHCFFLVDDIVFRKEIDLRVCENILKHNPNVLTFSLRLGLHLNYCYPMQEQQHIPNGQVQQGMFLWDWTRGHHDWGYPFSVDGHVFRKSQLLGWCKHLQYSNPNTFEGELQTIKHTFVVPEVCITGVESFLFNNPLNRVQEVYANRSENVTTESLLGLWNQGLEIDIDALGGVLNTAAHFVVELPTRSRK